MWRFIVGFGLGVYTGTYYDCKPTVDSIKDFITKNFPKEK